MRSNTLIIISVLGILIFGSLSQLADADGADALGSEVESDSNVPTARSGSRSGGISYSQPDLTTDYYYGDHTTHYLYHPNGYRYNLDREVGVISGIGTEYIALNIEYDNLTLMDQVLIDLSIFQNIDIDFNGYIDVGPDGNIYIFLYSSIQLDTWEIGVLRLDVHDDPVPLDHSVLLDREVAGEPEEIRFYFSSDGIIVSFYRNHILNAISLDNTGSSGSMDGENELIVDPSIDEDMIAPCVRGILDDRFWVILQREEGKVVISWYDDSLLSSGEELVFALGAPVGMDNFFRSETLNGRIYLFVYLDNVAGDSYGSMACAIIGGDGSLIDLRDDLTGGEVNLSADYPLVSEGSICIIGSYPLGMIRYDADLEYIGDINLSRIWEWDYPMTDVRVYHTEHDIVVAVMDYEYFPLSMIFASYPSDGIPEYGAMFVDGELLIEDHELNLYNGIFVGEGGKLTLIDTSIHFKPGNQQLIYGLVNEGSLLIDGCAVGDDMLIVENYGNLTIEDPPANINVINNGEMECSGSGFSGPGRPIFEIKGGNSVFSGLTFIDDNRSDERTPCITGLGISNDDQTDLFLTGCKFENINTVVSGNHIRMVVDSCIFENIGSVMTGDGIEIMRDSYLHNVTQLNAWSGGEANIVNSTFVQSDLIFRYSDDFKPLLLSITDCRFIECEGIFSLMDRIGSTDDIDVIMSGCTINGSVGPLDIPENVDVTIEGCLIEGDDRGVVIESSDGSVQILNNTFRGLNISLEILDTPKHFHPEIFRISGNSFIDDNVSIFYWGYRNVVYSAYSLDEENPGFYIEDLFIDCRYNRWDSRSPSWVAGHLTQGCYFLPYYTLDGRLIETDDMDLDMIDDDWERENHLDPDFYYDRFMDEDKDRYSNYEEFRSGTDPNDQDSNPADRLRVVFITAFTLLIFLPLLILMIGAFWGHPELRRRKRQRFYDYYRGYSKKRKDYERKARDLELKKSVSDLKELLSREGVNDELKDEVGEENSEEVVRK